MINYYYDDVPGFERLGDIQMYEPSYDFDILLVLTDGKKIYMAQDSGCSCPTPFENVRFEDFDVYDTTHAALNYVNGLIAQIPAENTYSYTGVSEFARPALLDLVDRLINLRLSV